jgi:hypothetical protein
MWGKRGPLTALWILKVMYLHSTELYQAADNVHGEVQVVKEPEA